MKPHKTPLIILTLFLATRAMAAPSSVTGACSDSESWVWGSAIPKDQRSDFETFLKHGMKPAQAFAEGLAMRSSGAPSETNSFGEYWVSRALHEAKLDHIAFDGFTSIASDAPSF